MAKTLRTSDGDALDTLCFRFYGTLQGTVEAVYDCLLYTSPSPRD